MCRGSPDPVARSPIGVVGLAVWDTLEHLREFPEDYLRDRLAECVPKAHEVPIAAASELPKRRQRHTQEIPQNVGRGPVHGGGCRIELARPADAAAIGGVDSGGR